jgi:hypothetical protein
MNEMITDNGKFNMSNPAASMIAAWIQCLNEYNFSLKPCPDKHITELSMQIFQKYQILDLREFNSVFMRILEGRYGKFTGSVDSQTIMMAFKSYYESRY